MSQLSADEIAEVITGKRKAVASSTPIAKKSTVEAKALALLGQGIAAETVASACGVSVSRISQLMSSDEFMGEVAELRFNNLQKHNERDDAYDALEDKLRIQFEAASSLLFDPMKLLRAIQVLNAIKRRGTAAPEIMQEKSTIVNLMMPVSIIQKFTTNTVNQVIQAGAQTLQTMPSHTMLDVAKAKIAAISAGENNDRNITIENGMQRA